MATEQQSSENNQERHSGGNVTQAPESGALGSSEGERNEQQAGSTGSSGSGQGPQGERGSRSSSMSRSHNPGGMSRARPRQDAGPFSLMRRFSEDMDRLFEGFFGPSLLGSEPFGSLMQSTRWPEIEVHQEGNRWVVQADVPGLRREDVNVEVRDDQLIISGERRSQSERNEGRYYRSERSYGSFTRAISLPEGANLESASASFENGVLRIELEVPEQQQRSRRIEVREGSPQ
jgi:HSP20 family protein